MVNVPKPRRSGGSSGRPAKRTSNSTTSSRGGRATSSRGERSDRPRSAAPRGERSDRPRSSSFDRSDRPRSAAPRGERSDRPRSSSFDRSDRVPLDRPRRARMVEPEIPEFITGEELDKATIKELGTLAEKNANHVARHLVAAGMALDEDAERAWQHAKAAAHNAGRIAVVRETAGVVAYQAGHFAESLAELRAATRMSGNFGVLPIMVDCERALGRPQKAIELAGHGAAKSLPVEDQVELRIVVAGARRDLGEIDAAIATLTCQELKIDAAEWAPRLRYALADAYAEKADRKNALNWFTKAAESDRDGVTDALNRIQLLET